MTVGKPNFNLNSFGIKYLSKDEVQEFLEKRQGESIRTDGETKTKPLGRSGRKASKQIIDQKNDHSPASDSKLNPPKPKVVSDSLFGQARERVGEGGGTGSVGRKFTEHTPKPIKPTDSTIKLQDLKQFDAGGKQIGTKKREDQVGGTRSVFNSSTYGYGGENKVREQFKDENQDKDAKAPPLDKPQGSGQEFKEVGSKGRKWLNENKPEKDAKPRGKKEFKGISPPKLADAPKDVKGEETKIGQKKIRVGVGEKANEKLQETGGVGERRYASDRKSPHSLPAEKKRKKEAAAARKLGIAQSKVHGLKRRQEIDALGKSNDIIMDMAIMKLNLMKDALDGEGGNKPLLGNHDPKPSKSVDRHGNLNTPTETFATERADTNIDNYMNDYKGDEEPTGTTLYKLQEAGSHDTDGKYGVDKQPKYRKNLTSKQPLKPKIAANSAETVFKAISLKLDLMKNTPKKGGKQLPQDFIGQTMNAKNSKMTKEKPLTEYDNYDNKHGLTARTERHRGNTLRYKKRDVKYGSSMDTQGMTPPAGSSLMDRDDAEVPKGKESPKDLGKSASEIIFKAISLKLELTSLK